MGYDSAFVDDDNVQQIPAGMGDGLPVTPEELALARKLINSRAPAGVALRAGFRYDRKGYEQYDTIGDAYRNSAYGQGDHDPIVLSLTIVLGSWESGHKAFLPIRDRLNGLRLEERLAEAEAAAAAAEAKAEAAQREAAAARAALAALVK